MTGNDREESPRFVARVAGVFYLLTIITSVVSLIALGKLVVYGDAEATANNIAAHQSLFRMGFVGSLLATVCYVAVTALFYRLFRPVNRSVSLLAAFVSLGGCAMGSVSCLFYFAPLTVAEAAVSLPGFNSEQLHALALVLLKLGAQANDIGLSFFGAYCLLIGYLLFKSSFLPRTVGALMAIGGLGWLTNSFTVFLAPQLRSSLAPYIMVPGVLAETVLTAWLLVAGVNAQRWEEQIPGARQSSQPRVAGASRNETRSA